MDIIICKKCGKEMYKFITRISKGVTTYYYYRCDDCDITKEVIKKNV